MQITLFPTDFYYSPKWYIFKESELGKIHDCINWDGLTELLPNKKTLRGSPAWLPPKGLFGLMFLKHYTGLSDEKLVDRFNTDWAMQMFCGILLPENESIKDNSFVSRIRSYLAKHVNLEQMQQQMLEKWKPNLINSHVMLADATAYESHLRYRQTLSYCGSAVYGFGVELFRMFASNLSLKSQGPSSIIRRKST